MTQQVLTSGVYQVAELLQSHGNVVTIDAQASVVVMDNTGTPEFSIIVGKNAVVSYIDIVSEETAAHTVTIHLQEDGAQARIVGMVIGAAKDITALAHHIVHHGAHTQSAIITKGVLTDRAQLQYVGRIHVEQQAAHAVGNQSAQMLLLSPDVRVEAIPDLDIYNNLVRCTHGVSITHIQPEKLFYMQSRSLSVRDATLLYVRGHIMQLLEEYVYPRLLPFGPTHQYILDESLSTTLSNRL